MKLVLAALLLIMPFLSLSQSLQVLNKENGKVAIGFEKNDRLFITKEGVNAVQPAILLRASEDSIFFEHDSFLITDLKKLARASNGNFAGYFFFSAWEVYGTSAQVLGFGILFFPGVLNEFESENIALSIFISGAVYAYGTVVKNLARLLKNGFFRVSNYPNTKFEFVAST